MNILSKGRIWLYNRLVVFYPWLLRKFYGMDIGEGTLISRKATLDRGVNANGLHIGSYTRITGGVIVLAHDACRHLKTDTFIGNKCFIGCRTIILPGVRVGNEVVIGAGSVVTKDIPDNCIAAGNPAKIIKTNIQCENYGVIVNHNI